MILKLMNKNLKNIFWAYSPPFFCAFLFTVPLVSPNNMFQGAFFGKEYGFYIFMTLLIIYTIIFKIFNHNSEEIQLNNIDITFLLFVIWNFISALLAGDSYINNKVYELIFLTIFYLIVKGFFSVKKFNRKRLIIASVILFMVANIEVIIGLLQLYKIIPSENPYFRITGTFHNPAPYSLFLAISFSYAFSFYLFDLFKEKYSRYISLCTSLAVLLVIPFTGNRASWIGTASGIAFILFLKYWRVIVNFKTNKFLKAGLFALVLLVTFTGIFFLYNLKKGSSDGRLLIWKVSGNIIKEQPITGVGYGRFNSVYNLYQADYFRADHNKNEELLADNVRIAYNDYIEILVESGIIGLLIFIGLLYFIFNYMRLSQGNIFLLISPIFVCVILALISYPLNTVPTKVLFIFFVAAISAQVTIFRKAIYNFKINKLILITFLVISIPFSIKQISKYLMYKDWLYAVNALGNGQTKISEEYFRKVNENLKYDLHFSILYAECLFHNQKYNEALESLNELKNIVPDSELFLLLGKSYEETGRKQEAIECFEESSYMVPGRVLPKYYLTKFHYKNGAVARADSLAEILFEMDIKVKSDTTLALINEIKELYNKKKQPRH